MKKWVNFVHGVAEDGLLWNSGSHFGDWLALDAEEGSYHGATPNDWLPPPTTPIPQRFWRTVLPFSGLKKTPNTTPFFTAKSSRPMGMSFSVPPGALSANTQTAHILSLVFGLTPPEYKERTVAGLHCLIVEHDGLTTGFLGTPYLCEALSANGLLEDAYMLLLKEEYPSWLYSVKQGATTIWEHWDSIKPDGAMWSTDMNSLNHYAYGAVADWIFSTVGGIDTSVHQPGFEKIIIAPRPCGTRPGGSLRWAETRYQSGYGEIFVRWEKTDGLLALTVKIPHNTTAEVTLPGVSGHVSGGDFDVKKGSATATFGSGTYHFTYHYQE